MGQLVNGRGNLIKQANEFQELGVAVKKELPAEIVERARLEVGAPAAEPPTDEASLTDREEG
ncbi:hypothetical protein [Halomonas sp. BM-2019]|uniref:hypothetical protein n=1 Tax=Halomonas sp. BM-2019 TaxID=2811227 RepID=UPI001B3C43AF|nr:MAG: hypothetical protein J5F18_12085 [Halomonas sp. BM-2019]